MSTTISPVIFFKKRFVLDQESETQSPLVNYKIKNWEKMKILKLEKMELSNIWH